MSCHACAGQEDDKAEQAVQDAEDERDVKNADANSKQVLAIVSRVGDGSVTAKLWGNQFANEPVTMSYRSYNLYWQLFCDKEAIQDRGIVSDWASHLLSNKADSMDKVAVANAQTAVRMTYDVMNVSEGRPRLEMLRLESKPRKNVYVVEDIAEGELTLVPFSTDIVVDDDNEKRVESSVKCGVVVGSKDRYIWIAPPSLTMPKLGSDMGKAQLEMFWCVNRVPEDKDGKESDEVNMHLVDCRVVGACSVRMKDAADHNARVARFQLIY